MISSITGISERDNQNKSKASKRKRPIIIDVDSEDEDEEEEKREKGEDEETEEGGDEENGRVTPGLAFWLAVNTASGLCESFENRVRKKFASAGFTFCECKVRLFALINEP